MKRWAFSLTVVVLSGTGLLAQGFLPAQPSQRQLTKLPVNEEAMRDTFRLVAFALGQEELSARHQQLMREHIQWARQMGDTDTIHTCQQMPAICQQIAAQPEALEQSRLAWRQSLLQAAAEQPTSPLAQIVAEITGAQYAAPNQPVVSSQSVPAGRVVDPAQQLQQQMDAQQQAFQALMRMEQQRHEANMGIINNIGGGNTVIEYQTVDQYGRPIH